MFLQIKENIFSRKNLGIYLLILVFVAVFSASFAFREAVFNFIYLLAGYLGEHRYSGMIFFIIVSALSAILSPLSSIPLVPFAVVAWGNSLTFIFLLFGWIVGGVISWIIGYFTGKKIIRKHYSFEKIEYYRNKLSKKAQFWIVLIFRLAIPSEITGFTLGILKYHFGKYLIITFLSELPFALLAVYSGVALVSGQIFIFAGLIILSIVFISVMSVYLKKHIQHAKNS